MTGPTRTCTEPGCERPHHALGLCIAHWRRARRDSTLTGPIGSAAVCIADDVFMPCPDTLLELAGRCAENDARAIVRLLWPHLLEASLAGVEPFTLGEVAS